MAVGAKWQKADKIGKERSADKSRMGGENPDTSMVAAVRTADTAMSMTTGTMNTNAQSHIYNTSDHWGNNHLDDYVLGDKTTC